MLLARRQLDDGRFRFGEWSFVIVPRNCQFRFELRRFFSATGDFPLAILLPRTLRVWCRLEFVNRRSQVASMRFASQKFFNLGFWRFLGRINFARICYYFLEVRIFLATSWTYKFCLYFCLNCSNYSSINFARIFLIISCTYKFCINFSSYSLNVRILCEFF